MSRQKKRKWPIILLALIMLAAIGNSSSKDDSIATPTATKTPSVTQSATNTPVPISDTSTTVQPEEPLTIFLKYPELGEYGEYYTFNKNVKKAEASDKNTVIQCYVPAGKYTVTNEGNYPAFVFIYSRKTVINSSGWEEAAEYWQSDMLQPGDSCDIEVPEDHYIKLFPNNVWKLVER